MPLFTDARLTNVLNSVSFHHDERRLYAVNVIEVMT